MSLMVWLGQDKAFVGNNDLRGFWQFASGLNQIWGFGAGDLPPVSVYDEISFHECGAKR
ncbi:hypothetical protein [Thalassospira profundimaris]|nr:hypothetical protein [Thalassospira profundimaris]